MTDRLGQDALARQLRQDRSLRHAARALVDADIAKFKTDFSGKALKTRALDRVTEGAADMLEEAVEVAQNNKGALITLVLAIGLWFARNPILSLFSDEDGDGDVQHSENAADLYAEPDDSDG